MKKYYTALSVVIILIAPVVWAAPSVTSVTINGSDLYISGSGFGTKSPVAPLQWDTFENGTTGALVTTPIVGETWGNGNGVYYNTTQKKHGSKSAYIAYNTVNASLRRAGGPWDKLYISYYMRASYGSLTCYTGGTGPAEQHKFLRVEGDLAEGNGVPLFAYECHAYPSGERTEIALRAKYEPTAISGTLYGSDLAFSDMQNTWNKVSIYADLTSAQKRFDLWENNVDKNINDAKWVDIMPYGTSKFNEMWLGFYVLRACTTIYVWIDDVYIDNTAARIEIGNNSIYNSCTIREPQIPHTTWDNTTIRATLNQGSIPNGTAYLFVVDSTGAASAGKQITIGTADTTKPTVTSSEIDASGQTLTVNISEQTTGYTGFTISASGGASTLTYSSDSGTQKIYSLSRTISAGETVTLTYTPGNIQDTAGNSMLGFSGASVTNSSAVGTDSTPPSVSNHSPAQSATEESIYTSISANVTDAGAGVDVSTIEMKVDDVLVTPTITGTVYDYALSYTPESPFSPAQIVTVTIDATDLSSNAMTTESWSFSTAAVVAGDSYGRNSTDDYASGADTYLNAGFGGDDNYSTETNINTYIYPINTAANTIIRKYDLSGITGDIIQAKLYMYVDEDGGDEFLSVSAHAITGVSPVIGSATWLTYDGVNNWVAAGGLGNISAAESTTSVGSAKQYSWDVTEMAQAAVAADGELNILLQAASGSANSYRFFHSDESTDGLRPQLIILTEEGAEPPPPGKAGVIKTTGGMPIETAPGGLTIQ